MDEITGKKYNDLVISKELSYDNTFSAINTVKNFILKNKHILVGGIAIDYALKAKGQVGIYDEKALLDFDIISSTHFQDAYAIATLLSRRNFTGISVINALHPSTMKVRVNFKEVCDITYIPEEILNAIPTIYYRGFTLVHPHYQYIDQHRSLSYPYENAPRETIMYRPLKDMMRYDILYASYPLRILYTKNTRVDLKDYKCSISVLNNQCISGFVALNYWIHQATLLGFKPAVSFGSNNIKNDTVSGKIPVECTGVVLYTNDIKQLFNTITDKNNVKFYTKLLDKLPRRIIMDKYELFDLDQKIAAHEINMGTKLHVANLQAIMMYLLINYILLQKISGEHRSYAYYAGYIMCQDLITWASNLYVTNRDIALEQFFPTAEVYGERNLSDSYIVSKHNFDIKNKTVNVSEKYKYAQPHHVYDRDLLYKKVPKKYYDFNLKESDVFNFAGNETSSFFDSDK